MKKGRKPKSKNNLQNLEKEKHRRNNFRSEMQISDDLIDDNFSMGMRSHNMQNNNMIIDSENISLDERSDFQTRTNNKNRYDRSTDRSVDGGQGANYNMGPVTRRKEHQMLQSNGKGCYEKCSLELNNLKKFDEFYKEKKNVENEMYLYRPPRISKDAFQVYVENFDTNNCFNRKINNIENNIIGDEIAEIKENKHIDLESDLAAKKDQKNLPPTPLVKVFDYTKISKDDLNYYLKFVKYYKESSSISVPGNIFLKGVYNFELNALILLKECEYDLNLAFRKILFPVLDLIIGNEDLKYMPKLPGCLYNFGSETPLRKFGHSGNDAQISNDPMIYVNSALNDLIGSNIQEKEAWLDYVKERIESGIDSMDLQILIDLGGKMKIDIPDFVRTEIENSFAFANLVRRHLNEKNSINDIIKLLENSKKYKVKTDEFYQLEDVYKKAKNWISKLEELDNKTINYKLLHNLYQESKTLPINFENSENIKNRFLRAQNWQEKYSGLPKHSKTRGNTVTKKSTNINSNNNSSSNNERCTVSYLQGLITECNDINFTSNDVVSLKNNFDKLREAEAKISMTLEDNNIIKTQQLLTEFVNTLDSLKFTTELYDVVVCKLEYLLWDEKKNFYMNTKVLKMKHLRNLIKEANLKNLNSLPEMQEFRSILKNIENWMEKMSNIFYNYIINNEIVSGNANNEDNCEISNCDEMEEENESKYNQANTSNSNNNSENYLNMNSNETNKKTDKRKIEFADLLILYEEGKQIPIKPEEVEHLLMKCDEFFEFINECKIASQNVIINSNNHNNKEKDYPDKDLPEKDIEKEIEHPNKEHILKEKITMKYDYQKLSSLRKQILKYNIKCEEFDLIDSQMNLVQLWMESYEEFIFKYTRLNIDFKFNFLKIETLENRQDLIEIFETFIRRNSVFYENLIDLLQKMPHFAKTSREYEELLRIKLKAEILMNVTYTNNYGVVDEKILKANEYSFYPQNMELEELQNFINSSHLLSVSREFFGKLLCFFRAKSWTQMAYLKQKMCLHEAEGLIKEANNINFHGIEIEEMKNQILKTKEWVKHSKKLVNTKDKIKYDVLRTFIIEGEELPLHTAELQDLIQFDHMLQNEIFSARNFLLAVHSYSELYNYSEEIEQYPIDAIPEFEIVYSLTKMCKQWKIIAEKILSSRKLSVLFFKQDLELLNGFKIGCIDNNLTNNKLKEEDEEDSNSNKISSIKNSNSNIILQMNMNMNMKSSINKNNFNTNNLPPTCSVEIPDYSKLNKKNSDNLNYTGGGEGVASSKFDQNGKLKNTNISIINNNYYYGNGTGVGTENNLNSNSANTHNSDEKEKDISINNISTPDKNNMSKKKEKRANKQNNDNVLTMVNNIQNQNYIKNHSLHLQQNKNGLTNSPIKKKNSQPYAHTDSYLVFSIDSKINTKKFENYPYEDQLKILSRTVVLKEDNPLEQYCICRRGDDSLHYMLMCENCKEWFHGKCLKINKTNADKILQYLCVACSRRKDILSQSHHYDFHNLKRISYEKFCDFLMEGVDLPIIFDEMEQIKLIYNNILNWVAKYDNILKEMINFLNFTNTSNACNPCSTTTYTSNLNSYQKLFEDGLEKSLLDLYHESEGFPVDLDAATNIIIILKHYDWFRTAYKSLENKKVTEKNYKRIVCSSYSILNKELIVVSTEMDKIYFNLIIEKGLELLSEISRNFDQFSSIYSEFKNKYDKKYLEIVEELIHHFENTNSSGDTNNVTTQIKNKNREIISNEIEKYIQWENNVKAALNSPSLFEEKFNNLLEKAKSFNFKSAFLEKFRRIAQNPIKDQVEYYKNLLFEDNIKKKNINYITSLSLQKRKKKKDFTILKDKQNMHIEKQNNLANK